LIEAVDFCFFVDLGKKNDRTGDFLDTRERDEIRKLKPAPERLEPFDPLAFIVDVVVEENDLFVYLGSGFTKNLVISPILLWDFVWLFATYEC
jgi:hypothetical protein